MILSNIAVCQILKRTRGAEYLDSKFTSNPFKISCHRNISNGIVTKRSLGLGNAPGYRLPLIICPADAYVHSVGEFRLQAADGIRILRQL